jgi:RNA polymerase-binding transcription factor DksA
VEVAMDGHVDGSEIRSQAIANTDHALEEAHSLLERAEAELRAIELAIGRFGFGEEPRCEVCGAPVDATSDDASPGETRCAEHASAV